MRLPDQVRDRVPLRWSVQPDEAHLRATWRQASPGRIERALKVALDRDPGGWYVVGSSRALGRRSTTATVAGREVVLWRTADGRLAAGPGACPHLGALLDDCVVAGDALLCRWHGLALTPEGGPGWSPYAAHDDGVLLWVRLPTPGEQPSDLPVHLERPPVADSLDAVMTMTGACAPQDVIANRLDPWHGAWLHPYAFSHLTVDEAASDDSELVVDVTYRLGRRVGVPVRAVFSCPDARTIVMRITDGEGAGSVVETHATPLGDGRTTVTEATIAHSPRAGFQVARRLAPLLRPAVAATARRLWVDDMAYAERLALLRSLAAQ